MKKLIAFLFAAALAVCLPAQPTPAQGVGRIIAGTNITISPASGTGGAVTINSTGGGGSGTVTSVSVTTANGVSGSVATATTTPAISLTLSAITPSSISIGADPADAGDIRLTNAGIIAWEASPAGTDVTLTVNSSEQFVFSNTILSPDVTTSLTTPSTTFSLLNTTATTLNFAGAATTINMGNSAGTTNLLGILALNPAGSVAGVAWSGQGTAPAAPANSIGYYSPASVTTGYGIKFPATITTGVVVRTGTADPQTESIAAITGTGNAVFSASPTLTGTIGAASLTLSSLTSGRATYAGASGLLSDEAAYAYNAATNILTVGGVSLGAGSEASTIGALKDAVDGTTPLNNQIETFGAGTAYALTNAAAAIDFGTTDPVVVLANAGTYTIYAQIHVAYAAATVVAETATFTVRRTNNTAANLGQSVVIDLPVATTLTNSYGIVTLPPFSYTTAATNDSLTINANVSATLGAGTINATAVGTSIVAIRRY